jgi:hypothetical protein
MRTRSAIVLTRRHPHLLSTTISARVIRTALLLVVALGAVAVLNVSTARHSLAWSCSSYNHAYIDDGSGALSITVGRGCDDGQAHVWGWVYDVNCDGRFAQAHIEFYDGGTSYWDRYRNEWPSDGNGCGTNTSFSYSTVRTSWPWIHASVWAQNWGPSQSSGAGTWV